MGHILFQSKFAGKKNLIMQTKIILLLSIIAYSVIVGQSYMYIVALKNVQTDMSAGSFIQLRQLLDTNFRNNYQYAVYASLITSLILVLINIKADLLLMLKGNMPINDLINTWTSDHYPDNWAEYRAKWLQIFLYREVATITGFISLVIGAVFGMK